jgi:hypothetical protein
MRLTEEPGSLPSPADFAAALLAPNRAPPPGLAPAGHFAVYRNNVVVGLIEALAAAYPAVAALVGGRFFEAAARVYVRAKPPTSPVLILYGGGFPDFLESFEPVRRLPFLADVARLERAWLLAYHGAEASPLPLSALAALPEADLAETGVALHPTLSLTASRWPILSLWAANTGRGDHVDVDLERPEGVAVLRPHGAVETHRLDPGVFAFFQALQDGATLGGAAAAALAAEPVFDLAAGIGRLFAIEAAIGLHPARTEDLAP